MTASNGDCLVCGRNVKSLVEDRVLLGSTTRADKLHAFALLQCGYCGHIQKALDENWYVAMNGLYERHYDDYRVVGRQVNFVDGKIVSRDGLAVRKLTSLLDLGESGAMLDIGCGAGRFLQAFGEEKPGWTIAGYDVGDLHKDQVLAIEGAEFYFGENALGDIREKFDLITLNHVVEHLTDPVSVLRDAVRLLKPAGRVVVRVPCFLAVNTDFFLLEHCSHFTIETLTYALGMAGLRVVKEIDGLSAIELGVVAEKMPEKVDPSDYNPDYNIAAVEREARACLAWAESLPNLVRNNANGREVGIFGVGGAGIWLGVYLRGEIAFFVDEDPGKQGHEFAGCPILPGSKIPNGAIVFVTFNSAQASKNICERLSQTYPQSLFMAPSGSGEYQS